MDIIRLENISKVYNTKKIFENFNLTVEKGEFLGIKGESGKGKSTLLNIIGLLETCDGRVIMDGKEINYKNTKEIQRFLRNKIGYLFQNFALIDDLNVYENLKIVLKKDEKKNSKAVILQELKKVGMEDALNKKVYQLSGGEQQRIAIVRLILHKSEIILADEPTGSLDIKNAKIVMDLLKEFHKQGKTVIMVSHDERAFQNCSRIVNL